MAVDQNRSPSPSPEAGPGGDAASPPNGVRGADPQDAQWVKEVLAGQRDSYAELVRKYQGLVYAVVLSYVRDAHRAEDLAQEVFVRAFVALPELKSHESFMPWLVQIARNWASHELRRIARRPKAEQIDMTAIPVRTENDIERSAEAFALVEALREPMRHTVLLKYQQGLSCKEIAKREGVAVGTITSRLSRALLRLREAARRPR